jgi:multidrug efflux pump subunit AcrB/outer membrane protein TolC
MVSELENSIITGLLLVVMVLLFFMGFRNSLFVGLAIPLSMLVSFMVLQFMGITLNMVVLFSLILALGMLVDNAIVIVENIYRHVEEGKSLTDASVMGVSEVAVPVATSTLTTVLAFAPMLFWGGIMGQFMGFLPKTLIIVLTSSLFVALVVIPTATSKMMKKSKGEPKNPDAIPETGPYAWVMRKYKRVLEWSIDHRYTSFFVFGVGTFVVTFVAYGALNHGTEFFPMTEPARAFVQVTMPDGTKIETTDKVARRIEQALVGEPDIDTFVTEVGVVGDASGMGMGSSVPHAARITIDFKPSAAKARAGEAPREGSTMAALERIRKLANQAVGATIVVDREEMGPPVGKPVDVQIKGEDFHVLGQVSADLQREFAKMASEETEGQTAWRIVDLSDDYKVGRPELRLDVDRAAAKRVGTNTVMVANTVRTAVAGSKASTLREGDEEYDIVVELDPHYKSDIQSILDLRVPGKDNLYVPLSTLASFETRGGSGSIKHLDRDKVVTITGDVEGQRVDLAQAAVAEFIADYPVPDGVTLQLGGSNEEEAEAAAFLMRAFGIAVVLMFLVLVTQFDSVTRPFIILMSVVLSLIGVLWGLIITGTPFGIMMTGVGVISLAGVVVNNAIVLLDYVQQVRDRGVAVREALIQAGLVRFRPVVLTAVTTVLGLIPMATGFSVDFRNLKVITGGESAQFWGPMAVAVCFGLGVATLLTLVMVPTMYSINEDISNFMDKVKTKLSGLFGGKQDGDLVTKPVVAKTTLLLAILGAAAFSGPSHAAERVSLQDALDATFRNNLDLKMAYEQTVQGRAQVGMAFTQLSPQLQLGANYTYNKDEIAVDFGDAFDPAAMAEAQRFSNYRGSFQAMFPDNLAVDPVFDEIQAAEDQAIAEIEPTEPTIVQQQSYFDANLSVVQPLFNAAAISGVRAARTMRDATYLQNDRVVDQVLAGVTRAYYGLVVARESHAIALDSVDNAAAHLALAKRQVEAGAVPPITELQAELGLSRAERELINAEAQLVLAEQQFSMLTGLEPDVEVFMPAEPTVDVSSLPDALESVSHRPDVMAAYTQADAARYQLRVGQASWAPTVQGRFTYSWTQNLGFNDDPTWWMVVVSANWTLWDGGYRIAQNKSYASQMRVAEYSAQQAEMVAEQEIIVAWQRYERAEEAYAAVQKEVALAEENLTLVTRGHEAGSATWMEVQDAQLMYDQAEIGYLAERMNRDLAIVDLAVATGNY